MSAGCVQCYDRASPRHVLLSGSCTSLRQSTWYFNLQLLFAVEFESVRTDAELHTAVVTPAPRGADLSGPEWTSVDFRFSLVEVFVLLCVIRLQRQLMRPTQHSPAETMSKKTSKTKQIQLLKYESLLDFSVFSNHSLNFFVFFWRLAGKC